MSMRLLPMQTTDETTWRLHETVKDEFQADALTRFYKEQVGYQAVKYVVRQVGYTTGGCTEVFEIYVLESKGAH